MIRIKNTAEDRSKSLLHRTAPKFELEPMLGDQRIRLRGHIDITEEHYEQVKHIVAPWVAAGMVAVIKLDAPAESKKAKLDELAALTQDMGDYREVSPPVKMEMKEEVLVEETLTTTLESAGAPVVEEAPPVVEEKPQDTSKKGPGKKKLF